MRSELIAPLATFLVLSVVFSVTGAPGIGLVDSGELTVVAQTLGIAHPTGYPLYTMLGRVWLLVTCIEPGRAMVLFSCLLAACACSLLAWIVVRWMRQSGLAGNVASGIAASLAAVGFGLSKTVWTSISYAEVYPLTFLLAAALLAATVLAQEDAPGQLRLTILGCYLWGLAFGNHLTIMWFAPVVVHAVIRAAHRSVSARTLWVCLLVFLAGASVNLFLPVRSSVEPLLDWGDPQTLENFVRHVTAWQYRVWMFTGHVSDLLRKLALYLGSLPADLGWGLCAAAALGMWFVIRRRAWFLLAAASAWLLGVIYNLNYDIPDIATYFLALSCPLFLIAVHGVIQVMSAIKNRASVPAVAIIAAILFPATALPYSVPVANRTHDRFAVSFNRELLATVAPNAFVLQANWDIQSPVLYLQNVCRERPDVVMLDLNLLQRSWYIKQEQRAHPEVFAGVERAAKMFLEEVTPFESGKRINAQRIEAAFLGMVNGLIERNLARRPVYVRDMEASGHPRVAAAFRKTPAAFFLRVEDTSALEPVLNPDNLLAGRTEFDEREGLLLQQAVLSVTAQGRHALSAGDTMRAKQGLAVAQRLKPDDPAVRAFKGMLRESRP